MSLILEDLFKRSRGKPVNYEGRLVHAAVFRRITEPTLLIIRFIRAIENPIQALSLDMDSGTLYVAGGSVSKTILRLDTCPREVKVHCRPGRRGGSLMIYNEWIDESGRIDAWLMNAGMLVEEEDNRILLRCSDGRGDPDFDDLVAEIEFL